MSNDGDEISNIDDIVLSTEHQQMQRDIFKYNPLIIKYARPLVVINLVVAILVLAHLLYHILG